MGTPLEDFAAGLGGGAYSPQQGSTLPNAGPPPAGPSALGTVPPVAPPSPLPIPQGGQAPLPIPQQQPVAPPVLQPPTGAAPLNQLNIAADPLAAMMQQRLDAIQNYNPNSGIRGSDALAYAMTELPILQKQAELRSQNRQIQSEQLNQLSTHLKDFGALPPDQQAAQGPIIAQLLQARGQLAGLNLQPQDVQHMLSSPDIAKQYASTIDDPLIDNAAAVARLSALKPGKERQDELGAIQTEGMGKAMALVQQMVPQLVAQQGGSQAKPIDAGDFFRQVMQDPQVKQMVQASPSLRKAIDQVFNSGDEKMQTTLAQWGLKPGKVNLEGMIAREKEIAKGPEVTPAVKDVLAAMQHPVTGAPLTPASAALLPNGAKIIQQAMDVADAREIKKKAVESYDDAQAIARSKGDTPMTIQMPQYHMVNPADGQPISPALTFNQGKKVVSDAGAKMPIMMNEKQYQSYQELTSLMRDVGKLVDVTSKMKGAGPAQALGAWYKSIGGNADDTTAAMQAYQGLIIRYQKALTGTGRYVQSEAVKMSGGFPSFYDSSQSGLNRLKVTADVLQGQLDASLGKMDFGDLQKKVVDAQQRIDQEQKVNLPKGYQMADFPDGSSAAFRVGTKLPNGGVWRK